MSRIKLYAENEETEFVSHCIDRRNKPVDVTIHASTEDGAFDRVTESANDYDLRMVTQPEEVNRKRDDRDGDND